MVPLLGVKDRVLWGLNSHWSFLTVTPCGYLQSYMLSDFASGVRAVTASNRAT